MGFTVIGPKPSVSSPVAAVTAETLEEQTCTTGPYQPRGFKMRLGCRVLDGFGVYRFRLWDFEFKVYDRVSGLQF